MVDINSKLKKIKIKKLSENTVSAFFSGIVIAFMFFGYFLAHWYTQEIHHFTEYRQIISIFLGVILAAILSVLIFYLGKYHDYQREFIKQEGIFDEVYKRYKRAIEERLLIINSMKSEIDLMSDEQSLKAKPLLESLEKNEKDRQSKFLDDEEIFGQLEKIQKFYASLPIEIIKLSLFDAWPFAFGFVTLGLLDLKPTLGGFYQLIIILCIGLGTFIHSWYHKEKLMMIFHNYYKIIINATTTFINMKESVDLMSRDIERMIGYLQLKFSVSQNK